MTSVLDLIHALRGEAPEQCDFCGEPYGEDRWPVPEEGGAWACNECCSRWEEEEAADDGA